MTDMMALAVSYAIVWLFIFGYLLYLARKVNTLMQEMRDLRAKLARQQNNTVSIAPEPPVEKKGA